jgi:hypothetical protein
MAARAQVRGDVSDRELNIDCACCTRFGQNARSIGDA